MRRARNFQAGKIDLAALRAIEDAAIRDVVRLQEDIGLPVVTDGEFRRENWYADFIGKLSGVVIAAGSGQGFAEHDGTPKHIPKRVQTTGKVSAPNPIVLDDYQFLASTTSRGCQGHDSFTHAFAFSWRATRGLRDGVP